MKTVSAALVMCLNIGVDPPDVVKTSQSSKLECWISKSLNSFFININKLLIFKLFYSYFIQIKH